MALDGFETSAVFFGDDGAAVAGEGFTFDFGRKIMSSDEISDEFRTEGNDGWILLFASEEHNARESRTRIFIDDFAIRCFGVLVEDEAGFEEGVLFGRRKDEVIDPLEEIGAGFVAHAVGELAGE
jgi:hypothetical protein